MKEKCRVTVTTVTVFAATKIANPHIIITIKKFFVKLSF